MKAVGKSAFGTFVALCGLVVATEVGGRVVLWKRCGTATSVTLFEADPELGYRHRPNSCSFSVRVNALGFRGAREVSVSKPPDAVRMIAVGGSTTFGTGNGEDETYPVLLERRLNVGGGSPRYEVINAGVPGYYSYQQVVRARKELLRLQPDVVVLFEGWNDFWYAYSLGERWRPDVIDEGISGSYTSFLYNSSLSYRMLRLLQRRIVYAVKRRPDPEVVARYRAASETGAVYESYQRNLEETVKAFLGHGARVMLIKPPLLLRPEMSERERLLVRSIEPFWEEYVPFVEAHRRLSTAIDAVARKHEVDVVDADAVFNALQDTERVRLFSDVIHLTVEGNRLLAERIFEQVHRRRPQRSVPVRWESTASPSTASYR